MIINPQAGLLLGYTKFQFSATIIHPETQVPIVTAGERVSTLKLSELRDAGADSVEIEPI